jgi:hypothetical protein
MNKMDKMIEEIQAERNHAIDAAMERLVKEKGLRPPKMGLPPRPPLVVEREDFRPFTVLFGKG